MGNKVFLSGRPTREPEIKQSQKGKVYCKIRLAVDRPYRGKDVPRNADYFTVIFFDKKAQFVFNNVAKGALVNIWGRLEQSEYINNVGTKVEEVSVVGQEIDVVEWLRKTNRPNVDIEDVNGELLVPREITKSLIKQIEVTDEDIPEDLLGRNPFDD